MNILGEKKGHTIHKKLSQLNFLEANTLHDQLLYIKEIQPLITVRNTIKLLSIFNDIYYQAARNNTKVFTFDVVIPPRLILTEKEEETIIQQIKSQQIANDCYSSKDIRELVEKIYQTRTGILECFNRALFFVLKIQFKK